jgi:antitoxin component YwqK of YwqJK toxin-antitoxin module
MKKITHTTTLVLMLTATQINAGFFDNLTNNLQNGDIGGLLTDVVSDVATELKKEQESNNKNQGTSFGSTANEEDVQEEHTENASKEPDTLHSSNIEVSASDLEICDMWYCGDKKGKTQYADGGDLFTGSYTATLDNGIVERARYKDGVQTYISKHFPSGQMKLEEQNKDFKKHGFSRAWYENGQKKIEGFYKNGSLIGVRQAWYENGQLKSRVESNEKCNKVGLYQLFYENGNKKKEATYNQACQGDGLAMEWYENGNKRTERVLKNAVVQYPYRDWYENGNLMMIHNGFPLSIPGLDFPDYEKYHENGELKVVQKIMGHFAKNESYYENGNMRNFRFMNKITGKFHQYQTDWYENGEVKAEVFYYKGEVKKQTRWDEDGSVLDTKDMGFRYSMETDLEDLIK